MGNLKVLTLGVFGESWRQTQERREFWKEKETQRYERGREVSQTWGTYKRKTRGCREEILEGNRRKEKGRMERPGRQKEGSPFST